MRVEALKIIIGPWESGMDEHSGTRGQPRRGASRLSFTLGKLIPCLAWHGLNGRDLVYSQDLTCHTSSLQKAACIRIGISNYTHGWAVQFTHKHTHETKKRRRFQMSSKIQGFEKIPKRHSPCPFSIDQGL